MVAGLCGGGSKSRLNLFVSGTETSIMMIEGEADFLTEEQVDSRSARLDGAAHSPTREARSRSRGKSPRLHVTLAGHEC